MVCVFLDWERGLRDGVRGAFWHEVLGFSTGSG